MTISPMSSLTQQLREYQSDFHKQASQDNSIIGFVKTNLFGRVMSLGISFILHAEAVCRAVIICFLSIKETFSRSNEELFAKQKQECSFASSAYSESLRAFCALFDRKILDNEPAPSPPVQQQQPQIVVALEVPAPEQADRVQAVFQDIVPQEQNREPFENDVVLQIEVPLNLPVVDAPVNAAAVQLPQQAQEDDFADLGEPAPEEQIAAAVVDAPVNAAAAQLPQQAQEDDFVDLGEPAPEEQIAAAVVDAPVNAAAAQLPQQAQEDDFVDFENLEAFGDHVLVAAQAPDGEAARLEAQPLAAMPADGQDDDDVIIVEDELQKLIDGESGDESDGRIKENQEASPLNDGIDVEAELQKLIEEPEAEAPVAPVAAAVAHAPINAAAAPADDSNPVDGLNLEDFLEENLGGDESDGAKSDSSFEYVHDILRNGQFPGQE